MKYPALVRSVNDTPPLSKHIVCYVRARVLESHSLFEFAFLNVVHAHLAGQHSLPSSEEEPLTFSWYSVRHRMALPYYEKSVYEFYSPRYEFADLESEKALLESLSERDFREHITLLCEALLAEMGCVGWECSKAGVALWAVSTQEFCTWHRVNPCEGVERCTCHVPR